MTLKQIRMISATFAVLSIIVPFSLPVVAGTPSGCTDLDGFPEQQAVDFESQVQPIFLSCTVCHGEAGSAGLDLRPGEAYGNLVGVTSTTNPPQPRVQAFDPVDSLLLYAVNCSTTGGPSFQMPGTAPDERALIRDWIAQGALARPAPRSIPGLSLIGISILVALIMLALLASGRWRVRSCAG